MSKGLFTKATRWTIFTNWPNLLIACHHIDTAERIPIATGEFNKISNIVSII